MAECTRRQTVPLDLKPFAVAILRAHLHIVRARNDAVLIRHAQAALSTDLLAGRFDDDGVDELDHILVLFIRDVRFQHNDGAAQHADLRRGEADAVGLRQRLAHIVEQRVQTGIEILDLVAVLTQLGVTIFQDHSCSHCIPLLSPAGCHRQRR